MKIVIQKQEDVIYEPGKTFNLNGIEHAIIAVYAESDRIVELEVNEYGSEDIDTAIEISKKQQIANITVEHNGMLFSADDESQSRMHRAIDIMTQYGVESQAWKLKEEFDGSMTAQLTVDDLRQIMSLGLQEVGKIVLQ